MIDLIKTSYFIFGVIVLAAAIQGGLKGSTASIVAGGILGLLILAGGILLAKNPAVVTTGLVLGLIGSLGVAGRFLPTFFKTQVIWPAGTLGILGAIVVVLSVIGFVKK